MLERRDVRWQGEYDLRMSTDTEIISRKLFTVDEFQKICDMDIFPPDSRFELIRGEIVEMPNPTRRHSGRVNKLTRVFTSKLGETVIVCIQNGMFVDEMSEPKPDVVIAKPLPELFGPFEPDPGDVLLLVEISDTSLRYDTRIKVPLYAQAGIPEYWILNIPDDLLEVRSDPAGGEYRRSEVYKRGQTITAQMLPGITFTIDEILA
jgi:Uma2 family endonuclease